MRGAQATALLAHDSVGGHSTVMGSRDRGCGTRTPTPVPAGRALARGVSPENFAEDAPGVNPAALPRMLEALFVSELGQDKLGTLGCCKKNRLQSYAY